MVDFISTMVYNLKKTAMTDRGHTMGNTVTDRDFDRAVFALYAKAVAAFQLGGALLPLAVKNARAALTLLATRPALTPEQQNIWEELKDYMDKSGCP